MKKLYLFIILVCCQWAAQAQVFAPEGSYWRYCGTGMLQSRHPFFLELIGKDTIEGKEVLVISGDAQYVFSGKPYIFHCSGDSVFLFYEPDSSFNLIYNFSFQIGDTLRLNYKNSEWYPVMSMQFEADSSHFIRMVVDSTGMIDIQGNSLRYYRMINDSSSIWVGDMGQFKIEVVEQIGLLSPNFITPLVYGGFWDHWYLDLFYYSNTQILDFYGDSLGVCISNSEIYEFSFVDKLTVFPNPVSDVLMVIFSDYEMTYTGYLSDIYGRKVMEIRPAPHSETVAIQVAHLPSGIYALTLSDSKGNIFSEKIIKK